MTHIQSEAMDATLQQLQRPGPQVAPAHVQGASQG